ncbi:MAG: oligoendopeptidase F [Gemmatimonadales bacterium]|nr:MAG: oligoendopeptidase F [Gemmatimonadales bacterium]
MSDRRWNLADIFPSRKEWSEALNEIGRSTETLRKFQGRLHEGPETLCAFLNAYYTTVKSLYAASSYASMCYHEDMRVGETAEMESRSHLVGTAVSQAASFMEPEILSIGREQVEAWTESSPELQAYRHSLDDILRRKAHTLGTAEEELVASVGLIADAPETIYGMLANADLPWPAVKLSDGSEVRLDQSAFGKHRASVNREDRQIVFDKFFEVWRDYARTCGATLFSQLKRDVFYSRVRKYPNSLALALDGNRIPEAVYHQLISQARAHLPVLHRYFGLRKRLLGLASLKYYDIYPPLVHSDHTYEIDEAKRLVLESVEPLGREYADAMSEGLNGRWMDVEPRPGKRSGAYMNGHAYDAHPYVLMNFQGTYDSVTTLAHEWGHALHSHLSNRAQTFANADYSIFTAEIASTYNEALLLDRVLKDADSDEKRLFYLGRELEGLRGTFFRQTMFAEFELRIHEVVEQGDSLSADRFTAMYAELLRDYHGQDKGVLTIDDDYTVEWAYIPHFYYNFYVYQYATSVAASSLLVERLRQGETEAAERYLALLASGGSAYPHEQLVEAGVDLASPEPYEALMRRMITIMDEIDAITGV